MDIVPIHLTSLVRSWRQHYDPAFWCGFNFVKEELGQKEVAKMVHTELLFKALSGLFARRECHHTSVVDEDVYFVIFEGIPELFDGIEVV